MWAFFSIFFLLSRAHCVFSLSLNNGYSYQLVNEMKQQVSTAAKEARKEKKTPTKFDSILNLSAFFFAVTTIFITDIVHKIFFFVWTLSLIDNERTSTIFSAQTFSNAIHIIRKTKSKEKTNHFDLLLHKNTSWRWVLTKKKKKKIKHMCFMGINTKKRFKCDKCQNKLSSKLFTRCHYGDTVVSIFNQRNVNAIVTQWKKK